VLTRLRQHDERVFLFVTTRRVRLLDGVMRAATHTADAPIAIAFALGLALGAQPTLHDAGMVAIFALAVSHLGVQALKRTVHRARPNLPAGTERLLEPPDRFSFPSGHAAASLSLALALAAVLPAPAGAAVLCIAGLTGVSRCYLGVHYPGDVVAGWTLAALAWWAAEPALRALGLL
jgi:undecaprenyl-diphosphatase